MSHNLSSKLAQLASSESMFADPYSDDDADDNLALAESLGSSSVSKPSAQVRAMIDGMNEKPANSSSKKKKKSKKEKLLEKSDVFLEKHAGEIASVFDGYIGGEAFLDDEDEGLRNTLVSMGRKYARDTEVTGDQSEVSKAYAKAEKGLASLLQKVTVDMEQVEKDLSEARRGRRNLVALGDLVSAKGQLYNQARSIIKEQNDVTKAKFELSMKIRKEKKDVEGGVDEGATATRAIQQLFSMNRKDMIDSMGGYSSIAGARSDDEAEFYEEHPDSAGDEDAYIQEKFFSNQNTGNEEETDGDKFLKYETMGVEYVLLMDRESGDREVIAEDRDGNIIPDYPMPSNIDQLHFDCVWQTGTATDDLHRTYKLREM